MTARPLLARPQPGRHQGVLREREPDARGGLRAVATVFVTNHECPWRCVMCDLWRYTTTTATPPGAITAQLEAALGELAAGPGLPEALKVYNAGSFFDQRAIPPADLGPIARLVAPVGHLIVECHPALVGEDVDRFLGAREAARGPNHPPPTLEVAMGLECADDAVLARLEKGMTRADFAAASAALARRDVAVRAFVLIAPPFVAPAQRLETMRAAVRFALECGVAVVSLVPTRAGNGALDELARRGEFREPSLAEIEEHAEVALGEAAGHALVLVDLWDLERFAPCAACLCARRGRLDSLNLTQRAPRAVTCERCGAGSAAA
ncbi:MAG: radical SAM protein [Deltaproteobacteria bacterium]|nr:radical SAM protein [Deltaproteobacteria bacterium]